MTFKSPAIFPEHIIEQAKTRFVKRKEHARALLHIKDIFPNWIFVICCVFLLKFIAMAYAPLVGDEAYYWLWGKHLALGYHDHPPLIGWINNFCTLLSNNLAWVRFPAFLCSVGATTFFYAFAQNILENTKKAQFALQIFLFLPILTIEQFAMIPDAPLIFSWTFCLWSGWKSISNKCYWPLTGLALGLAFLSKLTSFFLLFGFVLFFVLNSKEKFRLPQKKLLLGTSVFLLISSPFWIWNFRHGFENLTFQAHTHFDHTPPSIASALFSYFESLALNLSPFVFILFILATWDLLKKAWRRELRSQFLLSFFLPIQIFFLFTGLRASPGEVAHWSYIGYITLIIGCANLDGWRKLRISSLISSGICTLGIYMFLIVPIFPLLALQPLDRLMPSLNINRLFLPLGHNFSALLGYSELASQASLKLNEQHGFAFFLSDSYLFSSELTYYTSKPAYPLLSSGRGAEYNRWDNYQHLVGKNALWVSPDGRANEGALKLAFESIGQTEIIQIKNGPVTRTFHVIGLYNLKNPAPLRAHFPQIL